MKRILLDTHTLIWWMNGDQALGEFALEFIANENNQVYVSAASVWEMSIKRQLGKLECPVDLDSVIESLGFSKLPISIFHSEQAGQLPIHHKDPFDRMLIAQAQAEGLQIITKDEHFPSYGISLIDATK
ncbi:type II toxin-antitoxin system VapC family toxin [Paraglaciecola sp. MB-3u-78]|jgi:PIN domain nuclease of toxin-antitoxin system|uniref:type II toxin-antitoxin system VapC family toxin n=1 Tax=Paraglaciecola sp. MB-3u-78 TaxID=2058332 RepID=UPI000C33FBD2|nr:type II toxin-antitoxin system VapC family toxin [Paraglaciecola sp. MB-3u-78]PKG99134.1 PIN domain nuclease [Paraglaciecola sp. MB-3u-78]